MSDVRIHAPITIREVLSHRTWRAALPNGKLIFAYARPRDPHPPLQPGDTAYVLLSLCDFSEGLLVPQDLSALSTHHPIIDGVGGN